MNERERFARACYEAERGPDSEWVKAKNWATMGAQAAVNGAYSMADTLIAAGFGDMSAANATLDSIAEIVDSPDGYRPRLMAVRSAINSSGRRCEKARVEHLTLTCSSCEADYGFTFMALSTDNAKTRRRWARKSSAREGWVVEDGADICGGCIDERALVRAEKQSAKKAAKKIKTKGSNR